MCKESLIDFDKYEITNDGKIFSKFFNRYFEGSTDEDGYITTALKCTDGKKRHFRWHRVIWYYFNGEIPRGMQVNHIDECKTNNALSNLNLMTPKQNSNWGTRNQRLGETFKRNGKVSKPVNQIDRVTGEIITTFPSAREAARQLGIRQSRISDACNGYTYQYGKRYNVTHCHGYIWRYID